MRWLGAATVAVVWMLAGTSQADMNDAFGNTIVSHYPDGGWGQALVRAGRALFRVIF